MSRCEQVVCVAIMGRMLRDSRPSLGECAAAVPNNWVSVGYGLMHVCGYSRREA